jgi:hypothetical protein
VVDQIRKYMVLICAVRWVVFSHSGRCAVLAYVASWFVLANSGWYVGLAYAVWLLYSPVLGCAALSFWNSRRKLRVWCGMG